MMLFEIKSGEALPGSGDRWEYLRNGEVPPPSGSSTLMAQLLHSAMSPEPRERPTAEQVISACLDAAMSAAMAGA